MKSLITIISPARHSEYYISVVTNVVLYCHFKQFSMGIIPLCSEQFRKTFNTTRIPLKEQGNFCFTRVLSLVKLFYHKFKSFSHVMNYGTIFAASQQWKKSCFNLQYNSLIVMKLKFSSVDLVPCSSMIYLDFG